MGAGWYLRRLAAMGPAEVAWRVGQAALREGERRALAGGAPVTRVGLYGPAPAADLSRLGLNLGNRDASAGGEPELLGGLRYADWRTRWHADPRSGADWPVRFSGDYDFSARGVPGDVRTNWELNRHRQFALLAKSLLVTGDGRHLDELEGLFAGWNAANPFMRGPEWSSPMEVSVRLVNWLAAAAFLRAAGGARAAALAGELCSGAHAMAAHVRSHYSRHSSANNHAVVEAAGVAVAACAFGRDGWLREALGVLGREAGLQAWPDGVGKEQSLHYQLLTMEALCLASHAARASGREVPPQVPAALRAMARYALDCRAGEGAYVGFGDDDEGCVLCLSEARPPYADHVLALCTMELGLGERLVPDVAASETARWLYGAGELARANRLPEAAPRRFAHYPDGGVTVMRSPRGRLVLAFDHGPLGYGPLAAHGHADALSVQLWVDGAPLVADPGTYLYNGDPDARRWFRSTAAHSTVCLGGRDQSEQLGPFLWGRRARVSPLRADEASMEASASHDGYAPAVHARSVRLRGGSLLVRDRLEGADASGAVAGYLLVGCEASRRADGRLRLALAGGASASVELRGASAELSPCEWSPRYLEREPALRLAVRPEGPEWSVEFRMEGEGPW